MLVQRYPEQYKAFIGTGQLVAFAETKTIDYEQSLKIAKERGDTNMIDKLKKQGLPPYYGKDVYLQYLTGYMTKNPEIERPGYNTFSDMAGPEYGLYDKVNFLLGMVTTFNDVYQQLYTIDLRKQALKLEVPVYFMEGRHDINVPPALAEEYFKALSAPYKKFIWFEHSGHDVWRNEPDKFVDLMVNSVLNKDGLK